MKALTHAMAEERSAPTMYRKIFNKLNKKIDKKVIASIIRDEKRHLKALRKIKSRSY
jgi:rubrerythrin